MPGEHVHGNVGVARQAAAGEMAVVWFKIQQTQGLAIRPPLSQNCLTWSH